MREMVRNIQQARKQAGLEVDDRITLWLETPDDFLSTVLVNQHYTEVIKAETLAQQLNHGSSEDGFLSRVTIDGAVLTISLRKAD